MILGLTLLMKHIAYHGEQKCVVAFTVLFGDMWPTQNTYLNSQLAFEVLRSGGIHRGVWNCEGELSCSRWSMHAAIQKIVLLESLTRRVWTCYHPALSPFRPFFFKGTVAIYDGCVNSCYLTSSCLKNRYVSLCNTKTLSTPSSNS